MNPERINQLISEETGLSGDFYHDLNAMSMAVDSLGIDGEDWAHRLWMMVCFGKPYSDRKAMLILANATAAQRAEAFLEYCSMAKSGALGLAKSALAETKEAR